jgi:hypothetical protein
MTPAWAQRQEALLRDCIVSPDVFDYLVERLRDCAVPYQHGPPDTGMEGVALQSVPQIRQPMRGLRA